MLMNIELRLVINKTPTTTHLLYIYYRYCSLNLLTTAKQLISTNNLLVIKPE